MKILVVMPVNDNHKKMLSEAAPEAEIIYMDAASADKATVESADVIVGNVSPALISGSTNLKLMQLNSAGTDGYTTPGVLPEQAVLTNATGAYGLAISEHMIGMLLCLMKKLDLYHDNMKAGEWKDHGPVPSIYGSKTLVVGLGDIGTEFAVRMNAMGSKVSGIKRNKSAKPDYIDEMYSMDHFHEALAKADIVATCLPGTAETYKLFDKQAFASMKKGAYFINVGRGNAVDTDALLEALNSGHLGGAGIDVTDPEPLPQEHPLWNAKNILITPHVSGGYHLEETHNRIVGIAARNIIHLINNEPFENIVDMQTGYRVFKNN